MSKRFPAVAVTLGVIGRPQLPGFLGRSGKRRLELSRSAKEDLSIEERSRLGFADLEEGLPQAQTARRAPGAAISSAL